MSKRRVVVTGLGMLSPVGNTVESTWKALLAGRSKEPSSRFTGDAFRFFGILSRNRLRQSDR